MKVANAEQMRALDRKAIEAYKIPGIVLMENAALGVVRAMEERYGPLQERSVLVFCGKGNNGGDGMAMARHLVNRGVKTHVVLLGSSRDLRGDARINHEICVKMRVPIRMVTDTRGLTVLSAQARKADLIVDAILGTGLVPPVRGLVEKAVRRINRFKKPVVSVDLPTGLSADTSDVAGEVVKADLTVTFGLLKTSLVQYPSLTSAGEVRVADISLPRELVQGADIAVELIEDEILEALPVRKPDLHKGEAGRVLVVAGSREMPGAAVMTALACFRVGSGLVYGAVPGSVRAYFHRQLTEGILVGLPDPQREHLTQASVPAILKAAKGKNAVALGPGIGLDPETGKMVRSLIQKIRIPVVLDADGINHLVQDLGILAKTRAPLILTPHPGEMARLSGATDRDLRTRRVDIARAFAAKFGVILVLKGARTVVADATGRAWVNTTGNPGMATAGTGDVLTGMITGLVGQGMAPLGAALAGVYLHGCCGDRAARRYSERGLLSRDLIREIPKVVREMCS